MTPTAVSWRPMTTEGGLCIIRRPQVAVKWTKTRKPTTVTAENATQSSSSADRDRVTMRNRTLPGTAIQLVHETTCPLENERQTFQVGGR